MTFSVSLDRTTLTLDPLEAGAPSALSSFWLPEQGTSWPTFTRRKTRAPASTYLEGDGALLARVAGMGVLPLTVYVGGDTDEEVWAAREEWQAAVDQWAYDLTLTVGSASRLYLAECVDEEVNWGEIDSGMVRARICRGSVTIPLYSQQEQAS